VTEWIVERVEPDSVLWLRSNKITKEQTTQAKRRQRRAAAGAHLRESDCVAGHVRLELRNDVANYPFERSNRFPRGRPNFGHRDYSRLSCGVAETQLGPSAAEMAGFAAILSACFLLSWTGPARSDRRHVSSKFCHANIAQETGLLGCAERTNSEMSWQNIPLKGRTDFR